MNDEKLTAGLVLCLIGLFGGWICCFPIVLIPPGVILIIMALVEGKDRQIVYVQHPGYLQPYQGYRQYQQYNQPIYQHQGYRQQYPYAPPPQPPQYEEPPPSPKYRETAPSHYEPEDEPPPPPPE